jgi:hypothetical protein
MTKVVLQLKQCHISDQRRDVEIIYNITTKYTVQQMELFRKLLLQTTYSKRDKRKKRVLLWNIVSKRSLKFTVSLGV